MSDLAIQYLPIGDLKPNPRKKLMDVEIGSLHGSTTCADSTDCVLMRRAYASVAPAAQVWSAIRAVTPAAPARAASGRPRPGRAGG